MTDALDQIATMRDDTDEGQTFKFLGTWKGDFVLEITDDGFRIKDRSPGPICDIVFSGHPEILDNRTPDPEEPGDLDPWPGTDPVGEYIAKDGNQPECNRLTWEYE